MSDGNRPRARPRPGAGEQTRVALLDAGAQLLREQPVGVLINQIRATDVAHRAGRTIGAFYHHWADQDSYRRDLLRHVLAPGPLFGTRTREQVLHELREATDPLEIVRRNARTELGSGVRPEFVLSIALWGQAGTDPQVRELLKGAYRSVTDTLVPMYEGVFAAKGWAPRPPFTVRDVAVTVTALLDGLIIRAVIDPDAVPLRLPDEAGRPDVPEDDAWDLFGAVVLALLPTMVMPVNAEPTAVDPSTDVRVLVRSVWSAWAAARGPDVG